MFFKISCLPIKVWKKTFSVYLNFWLYVFFGGMFIHNTQGPKCKIPTAFKRSGSTGLRKPSFKRTVPCINLPSWTVERVRRFWEWRFGPTKKAKFWVDDFQFSISTGMDSLHGGNLFDSFCSCSHPMSTVLSMVSRWHGSATQPPGTQKKNIEDLSSSTRVQLWKHEFTSVGVRIYPKLAAEIAAKFKESGWQDITSTLK